MSRPMTSLVGKKYSRLLVLFLHHTEKSGENYWLCRCDCGNVAIVRRSCLRRGATKSCGCLQRELIVDRSRTHGLVATPEYHSWNGMKARCTNPKGKDWNRYGGRGIRVCDRWLNSFENFLADMGRRPGPGYSIERKENDGNYEPGNCCWATAKDQAKNRRPRRRQERRSA